MRIYWVFENHDRKDVFNSFFMHLCVAPAWKHQHSSLDTIIMILFVFTVFSKEARWTGRCHGHTVSSSLSVRVEQSRFYPVVNLLLSSISFWGWSSLYEHVSVGFNTCGRDKSLRVNTAADERDVTPHRCV